MFCESLFSIMASSSSAETVAKRDMSIDDFEETDVKDWDIPMQCNMKYLTSFQQLNTSHDVN